MDKVSDLAPCCACYVWIQIWSVGLGTGRDLEDDAWDGLSSLSGLSVTLWFREVSQSSLQAEGMGSVCKHAHLPSALIFPREKSPSMCLEFFGCCKEQM